MTYRTLFAVLLAAGMIGASPAAAQQKSGAPFEITVPASIPPADAERIAQSINRFFGISGTITTPLGGITIVVRSADAGSPPGARTANVADYANRSAEDVARNFLCEVACTAAAAAAAAACGGAPPVLAACLAAVGVARDECRRRC